LGNEEIKWSLPVMAGWHIECLMPWGSFLYGESEDGEEIYMSIPQGLEILYEVNSVLNPLRTRYALVQAAMAI
jgi:hypothetical protein